MLWKLFLLFAEFFKIGLFSVGGGLATIPFLKELAVRYDWFTLSDLADMIAVSESTPGPLGVNMATYVGYTTAGIPGGIIATVGLVLPALFAIMMIAKFLDKFNENKYVKNAFSTIRPAVTGLIAYAGLDLFIKYVLNIGSAFTFDSFMQTISIPALLIFAAVLAGSVKFKKVHPIFFILAGALLGIVFAP